MLDASDLLSGSARLFLGLLRGLWWLGWDFTIETIGWTLGWTIWRVLSLGNFPREPLGRIDEASWRTRVIVEVTGLAALATAIWYLSGHWPRL